mmetsp:Transcript_42075/g.136578  ORF Transcript_42075/g.136578 Transcript_42075/m.136578 type:complete len:228 (-) Transcript_42075:363-1046(-)
MTGTTTRVPPRTSFWRTIASATSSGVGAGATRAVALIGALPLPLRAGASAAAAVPATQSVERRSRRSEMACSVLPIPISSARMPPPIGPSSCAHSQPSPSFWYGSICAVSVAGGSRCVVQSDADASTSLSTSTSQRAATGLVAASISRTRAVSASVRSSSRPVSSLSSASAASQKADGRRVQSMCCQRVMTPQPLSSTSRPMRSERCGMSSPHTPHFARPVFAYSTE